MEDNNNGNVSGESNGVETDEVSVEETTVESEAPTVETKQGKGFDEPWQQEIQQATKLSYESLEAYWRNPNERTWKQAEMSDYVGQQNYEQQVSFMKDETTGKVSEAKYGTKGSQRLDGIIRDEDGNVQEIREVKNYKNANNLKSNIEKQTEARREMFGEDVKITYVVSPKFSVGEAEKLQEFCQNELDVDLEYQY